MLFRSSQGEITVGRLAGLGAYTVKIGGPSLSTQSADEIWNSEKESYNDIDELIEADFMIVEAGQPKNKASFVIGQMKYIVDGKEKTMDTQSYITEGRTMLPVRYAADALGIEPEEILWDSETKTVTVTADKVVESKLGSKEMIIENVKVPMTAAAEMKDSRVFIPVAEIARALDAQVEWNPETKTATFNERLSNFA